MKKLSVFLLLFFTQSTFGADFYSLCVGVNGGAMGFNASYNKYDCVFNKDAVVMEKMLKRNGAKTKLLYGWDVGYKEVYKEVENLSFLATEKDTTFIFFSMHGDYVCNDFVMPTCDQNVSGKKLIQIASKIKGKIIIAFDTCSAGAILKCNVPSNMFLLGASKEKESARWVKKLPKPKPCGYLTRPLYKIFSKSLNPSTQTIVNEINISPVPITQTLWYHLPNQETFFVAHHEKK